MARSKETVVKMTSKKVAYVDNYQTLNMNSLVAGHVPFAFAYRTAAKEMLKT